MTRLQFRQGDVLLEAIDPPRGGNPMPRESGVLYTGERTGHSHRIESSDGGAQVYGDEAQGVYIQVGASGARLVHEEHGPIPLPAGWYRAWRQREYTPGGALSLRD